MNDQSVFMHEIKNSLSNIYSLIDIIEGDPNELKFCLPLIKEAIKQVKNVEKDYDEFRKSGTNSIKIIQVNLLALINSITDEYKSMADEAKITFSVKCKNIKIQADATKLRQVLSNLISNAIKYNKPGGKVLIDCQVDEKINIIVSDTGIGLSPDEIQNLGTTFYRSKKIDVPGTGLGWALIKNICKILGWNVVVRSKTKPSMYEYSTSVILSI